MFIGLVWGQIWVRKIEQFAGPLDERLARRLVEILFAGLRTSPAAGSEEIGADLATPAAVGA